MNNEELRREVFEVFDRYTEGNSFLNKKQFKLAFICLIGHKPSKIEIYSSLQKISTKFPILVTPPLPEDKLKPFQITEMHVTKEQFYAIIEAKMKQMASFEVAKEVFQAFDENRRGFLKIADFERAMEMVDVKIPPHILKSCFNKINRSLTGNITLAEFTELFTNSKQI